MAITAPLAELRGWMNMPPVETTGLWGRPLVHILHAQTEAGLPAESFKEKALIKMEIQCSGWFEPTSDAPYCIGAMTAL